MACLQVSVLLPCVVPSAAFTATQTTSTEMLGTMVVDSSGGGGPEVQVFSLGLGGKCVWY